MPAPQAFREGFKIEKGMKIAGYVLAELHIGHNQLVQYREYSYPISMVFTKSSGAGSVAEFEKALEEHVSGSRVIDSYYGNPYRCTFGTLKFKEEENSVGVTSLGHGTRIPKN